MPKSISNAFNISSTFTDTPTELPSPLISVIILPKSSASNLLITDTSKLSVRSFAGSSETELTEPISLPIVSASSLMSQ